MQIESSVHGGFDSIVLTLSELEKLVWLLGPELPHLLSLTVVLYSSAATSISVFSLSCLCYLYYTSWPAVQW